MSKNELSQDLVALCSRITRKRARTVVEHIIKNGFITTEQLQSEYGYDHPPRAIRDVREEGVPIITYTVVSERSGRKIAAYKFGDPDQIKQGRFGGRKAFSKAFKDALLKEYGSKDAVTGEVWEDRYLQIDHRIPYEVGGDCKEANNVGNFMLLHGTSQRAKSWSCEHCENFTTIHDKLICEKCYWAYPEEYTHVAMKQIRSISVEFAESDVDLFNKVERVAHERKDTIQGALKYMIRAYAVKR